MKTTIKRENHEFLDISLTHVRGLMDHANCHGTPKMWAIAHENGHKTRKRLVFGHKAQTCIGFRVVVCHLGTIKPWSIAHENGHKTRKRRVFGHISPTCIRSYRPCKFAWNPKTMENNS